MDQADLSLQNGGQGTRLGPLRGVGKGHTGDEGGYHLHFDDVTTPPPCTLSILRFLSAPKVARHARHWTTF
ncbi:hypothetical protein [Achromobacter piechaudii]|uniref:hypothetical protein n=1 Tax=Achromobacter piechaudii TaxID=72556 RepID=UPI0003020332|nr:hypothetical protein [Achromobacter piechaudii]